MSWSPLDTRRLTAVAVATVALGLAIDGRWSWNVWLTTGLAGALAVGAALAADRQALRERWRSPRRGIAVGLASGLVMVGLTQLAFLLVAEQVPGLAAATAELYRDLDAPPGPRAAAPLLALVVLGEELIWRGTVPALLAGRLTPGPTAVVGTLLYALPQVASGSLLLVAVALAAGAVWTALGILRHDLWAPFVCHLVWSLALFSFWPLV